MSRRAAVWIAGAVLISALAVGLGLRRGGGGKAAAAPGPCDRYREGNTRIRWVCLASGAPVDVVTDQSLIVTVLHVPVRALLLDTEPLDPSIPVADPKNPPVRICVLDRPGAGFSGFVAPKALHEVRCPN